MLVLAVVAALAPAAHAAGPAWHIESVANSTVAPGGSLDYYVTIANFGDAPTNDVYTFTATLPAGMTSAGASDSLGVLSCSGDGTNVETCTTPDPVAASLASGFTQDTIRVSVSVDPGASGVLTSAMEISGGGAGTASTVDPTLVTNASPAFGVDAFDTQNTADAAGTPSTQAGGHPYESTVALDLNSMESPDPFTGPVWPVEPIKDVFVDLPPGLIGNPTVAAKCTTADLANSITFNVRSLCSPAAQVGTVMVRKGGAPSFASFLWSKVGGPVPVYNMVPPPGVPARFGFNVAGTIVSMDAEVRGSDYGLSVNVHDTPEALALVGTTVTLWGTPADPSHDFERACPGQPQPAAGGSTCSAGTPIKAFLRNPTSCPGTGLPTTVHVDSWANPGVFDSRTSVSHLPPGYPYPPDQWGAPQGPTGCDKVPFDPKLTTAPSGAARAGGPLGLKVDLSLPQSDDPSTIGEADLRKAVVTLPAGVAISPSSANGLAACTPAQIGLHSDSDPSCPDASKIGSVQIDTPLLDIPLKGSIYLAAPHDNPFGSLLALYLTAKGPGFVLKLPGQVSADASTGQLTTTFDDNPQLPFTNLHLEFVGGAQAPLVAPSACGTYSTHAVLTSWSGKTVVSDSTFDVTQAADGSACKPQGFSPGFVAGTQDPVAGGETPFLLRLTRDDTDQQFKSVTVDMPQGLTGEIANVVKCPEAAANAGTCQDVSRVGAITVGSGAGANPFYIPNGRAYLTGPYHGGPYGLSMVVPAIAGPFDLGNVIVRAAIEIDRRTSRLTVVSDALPRILQGIPLDIRDVRMSIDRPHFIINPTNCSEKRVYGTIESTLGAIAHGSTRFEVGDCAALPSIERLRAVAGAKHHTRAGSSTPLTTTLTMPPHQANLRSVSVTLPGILNARLDVLNRACTLAQFEAGHCGRGARAGSAVAVTPLLRDPLRGSVYFVRDPRSTRPLPDLIVALRGEVAIDLVGKVGVNPRTNQLTTKFDTIPDVPVTKFVLRLVAGSNGPLGTVANLCSAKAHRATLTVAFRNQNGASHRIRERLGIRGCARR